MPQIDRPVVFSEHAERRLIRHDIEVAEVLGALETAGSRHRRRKDGVSECRLPVPTKGVLKVMYEKTPNVIRVVTAHWE